MLTREQLLSKRSEIVASIAVCKNKVFNYSVQRPFQQFGEVCEMQNKTLVYAYAKLKELNTNITSAAAELGVPVDTKFPETIQGYTTEEWKQDFLTRVEENKNTEMLNKLNQALKIIDDNLSDDDKFALAMGNLENILGGDKEFDAILGK